MPRPCIIGLDEREYTAIAERLDTQIVVHETLPRILVRDGKLYVESDSGLGYARISAVVFHGIFENDHDTIAGLALWGGPCLPNAQAMMDCRLKLPCLVRALKFSEFAAPPRGYGAPGVEYATDIQRVAKWGNWHCGENKLRFQEATVLDESSVVEPFLAGQAVRVVVVGDRHWQIKLEGNDWLKSIHHPMAAITEVDEDLLNDTRKVADGFGLEVLANDYIVTNDGVPHLLEVNHIPNVTRFPEIWEAYAEYAVRWLAAATGSDLMDGHASTVRRLRSPSMA